MNSGEYFYNWSNGHRMLITNQNCTGGDPSRRDLQCSALHRDGNLYGYGTVGGRPWCCLWHAGFTPTPPDWVAPATLVDAHATFAGVPCANYSLVKPIVYPEHHYLQRLDDGLPLAFVNGFGSVFVYSNVSTSRPIPESTFDFPVPGGCNDPCPWGAPQLPPPWPRAAA